MGRGGSPAFLQLASAVHPGGTDDGARRACVGEGEDPHGKNWAALFPSVGQTTVSARAWVGEGDPHRDWAALFPVGRGTVCSGMEVGSVVPGGTDDGLLGLGKCRHDVAVVLVVWTRTTDIS